MTTLRSLTACIVLVAGLVGCTMGPDYRRPDTPTLDDWSTDARQAFDRDTASTAVPAPFEGAAWWKVFADPALDQLMARAESQNLDVQTAVLRIAEARAQRDSAAGAEYPTIGGTGVAGRARLSQNSPTQNLSGGQSGGGSTGTATSQAPAFNAFQAGFDAIWELDIFGGTRRNVEAAEAQITSAAEGRHDALVSTTAEIARNYFSLRGAERRLAIANAQIETEEHLGRLIESRRRAGLASSSDVATQTAQVAQARASLPSLQQSISQSRNRIALLLALPPGGVDELVKPTGTLPALPPQVPVGMPSELLRRRPDVREKEAELHARTALIGVATANLFPRVTLGGSAGFQSSSASSLTDWASRFFIGGAQVSIPIFQGGQLRAQVRVADAQARQAVLAYRQSVLNAFHDVDNALVAYGDEQRHVVALQKQFDDANRARDLARGRYQAGLAAFIDVLDAERTSRQAEQTLAQGNVDATTDLVALFKALGGGWSED